MVIELLRLMQALPEAVNALVDAAEACAGPLQLSLQHLCLSSCMQDHVVTRLSHISSSQLTWHH